MTKEDVDLLLEANRLVTSDLNLPQVLTTILELTRRVMRADASSVLLLDESGRELYFDVAIGGVGESLKGTRVPVGQRIAGWVAQEGKAVIANDAARDPRWKGEIHAVSGFKTKSIMAVPMKAKGKVIGVVEAINRPEGFPFTEADLKVFEAFTSQAAVAIENARLFNALTLEKEKFRRLHDEMADGAILVGEKGEILSFNQAAARWFGGLSVRNIRDFSLSGFLLDPDPEGLLKSPAREGQMEIQRARPSPLVLSGRWAKIEAVDSGKSLYLFVFREITSSK